MQRERSRKNRRQHAGSELPKNHETKVVLLNLQNANKSYINDEKKNEVKYPSFAAESVGC